MKPGDHGEWEISIEVAGPGYVQPKNAEGTRAETERPGIPICACPQRWQRFSFGDKDPMDQLMKIDNKLDVKVTGVYEDPPSNTSFATMSYMHALEAV